MSRTGRGKWVRSFLPFECQPSDRGWMPTCDDRQPLNLNQLRKSLRNPSGAGPNWKRQGPAKTQLDSHWTCIGQSTSQPKTRGRKLSISSFQLLKIKYSFPNSSKFCSTFAHVSNEDSKSNIVADRKGNTIKCFRSKIIQSKILLYTPLK